MNRLKSGVLLMTMVFAAMSHAASNDASTVNLQQSAKRPYTIQNAEYTAEQSWEGATMRAADVNPKEQLEQRVNLQFSGKRPYIQP